MSHVNAIRLVDCSNICFGELQQVQRIGITFGREGVLLGRCLSCLLYPHPVELLRDVLCLHSNVSVYLCVYLFSMYI